MTDWPSLAKFQMSPQSLMKSFDDRVVLLHMRTRKMHILNTTGSRLWRLILEGNTREQMQAKMLQEFDVSDASLSTEIDTLLDRLNEQDFIRRKNE